MDQRERAANALEIMAAGRLSHEKESSKKALLAESLIAHLRPDGARRERGVGDHGRGHEKEDSKKSIARYVSHYSLTLDQMERAAKAALEIMAVEKPSHEKESSCADASATPAMMGSMER